MNLGVGFLDCIIYPLAHSLLDKSQLLPLLQNLVSKSFNSLLHRLFTLLDLFLGHFGVQVFAHFKEVYLASLCQKGGVELADHLPHLLVL